VSEDCELSSVYTSVLYCPGSISTKWVDCGTDLWGVYRAFGGTDSSAQAACPAAHCSYEAGALEMAGSFEGGWERSVRWQKVNKWWLGKKGISGRANNSVCKVWQLDRVYPFQEASDSVYEKQEVKHIVPRMMPYWGIGLCSLSAESHWKILSRARKYQLPTINVESLGRSWVQWLTPIMLAIWEVKMRRMEAWQKVLETPS
jgi:hypothetical protein